MSEENKIEEEAVREQEESSSVQEEVVETAPEVSDVQNQEEASAQKIGSVTKKTEVLAIIALVLGILSMFFCFCCGLFGTPFPIGAIICGFIAKNKIAKNPELQGKGMAFAGIILGFVSIILIGLSILFGAATVIMEMINKNR